MYDVTVQTWYHSFVAFAERSWVMSCWQNLSMHVMLLLAVL